MVICKSKILGFLNKLFGYYWCSMFFLYLWLKVLRKVIGYIGVVMMFGKEINLFFIKYKLSGLFWVLLI